MSLYSIKRFLSALCGIIVLISLPLTGNAVFLGGDEKPVVETVTVPGDIKSNQVGDFVAPLSEQQVRELLIANLKTQAEIYSSNHATQPMSVIELLQGAGNPYMPLGRGIQATFNATSSFGREVSKVLDQLEAGQGFIGLLKMFGLLVMVLVAGRAFEWICLRRWHESVKRGYLKVDELDTNEKTGSVFMAFLANFCGFFSICISGLYCR